MLRLAFLASNNGSSFRAIVSAAEAGRLAVSPVLTVSNRATAPALDFAKAHGLSAHHVATRLNPAAADERLEQILKEANVDLVVLSGYLRKLGPRVLAAMTGRILNIHPALLPKYGGQGMYGLRVHEAVLAAGESMTGASVHLVDEQYDHGPVLAQTFVPVEPGDTPHSLADRVMAAEPTLYIETLGKIASGALPLPMRLVTG
jgi:phosphoribosylglycinamide formyltransferase-1